MSRWRLVFVVLVLGAFMATEAHAAYYKVLYVAKRDGHLQMWRTKDGVRTQPDPAVDQDMLAGDSAWLNEDYSACNDHDLKWTNAASNKKCNMVGHAYSYNTFGDFLDARPGSLPHFALIDIGDTEIDCALELEIWSDFLETNPLPDQTATYIFTDGICPDLPGYMVTETLSGISFTGVCEVEGLCTLMEQGESVPSLNLYGTIALLFILSTSALFIWRRRGRA